MDFKFGASVRTDDHPLGTDCVHYRIRNPTLYLVWHTQGQVFLAAPFPKSEDTGRIMARNTHTVCGPSMNGAELFQLTQAQGYYNVVHSYNLLSPTSAAFNYLEVLPPPS